MFHFFTRHLKEQSNVNSNRVKKKWDLEYCVLVLVELLFWHCVAVEEINDTTFILS